MKCQTCLNYNSALGKETAELARVARLASRNPSSKNVSLALKAKERKKNTEHDQWMHIVHEHKETE